jgi:hypothetical protein
MPQQDRKEYCEKLKHFIETCGEEGICRMFYVQFVFNCLAPQPANYP